jgi:hypothetical protein
VFLPFHKGARDYPQAAPDRIRESWGSKSMYTLKNEEKHSLIPMKHVSDELVTNTSDMSFGNIAHLGKYQFSVVSHSIAVD